VKIFICSSISSSRSWGKHARAVERATIVAGNRAGIDLSTQTISAQIQPFLVPRTFDSAKLRHAFYEVRQRDDLDAPKGIEPEANRRREKGYVVPSAAPSPARRGRPCPGRKPQGVIRCLREYVTALLDEPIEVATLAKNGGVSGARFAELCRQAVFGGRPQGGSARARI
jgi:hypothetical protein